MEVYTIGHSNHSQEKLIRLLCDAGITLVLDVRAWPRSKRHPQFNDDALARALAAVEIDYRHVKALGGKRAASTFPAGSPNGHWAEPAFRHYADHALSESFTTTLERIEALADAVRPVLMCAEADWRHCHRRIITDHLISRGSRVVHLLKDGGREAALLDPVAVARDDGTLVYPPRQASLF